MASKRSIFCISQHDRLRIDARPKSTKAYIVQHAGSSGSIEALLAIQIPARDRAASPWLNLQTPIPGNRSAPQLKRKGSSGYSYGTPQVHQPQLQWLERGAWFSGACDVQ